MTTMLALKQKLKGRNIDIHVSDMTNYQETKQLIKKNIESINQNSLELETESHDIKK
ncbi:MAG: hypothetical protein PHI05_05285 [Bacilli bacterium]|nr:hypothetical protein [Bacilli bacterium]